MNDNAILKAGKFSLHFLGWIACFQTVSVDSSYVWLRPGATILNPIEKFKVAFLHINGLKKTEFANSKNSPTQDNRFHVPYVPIM